MTLPKTLLAAGILFTGLIGGLYFAASTILLHSLRQAEEQNARQAVVGVLSIFTQTQEDFNSRVADWSAWDDTYVFIQDANKNYIASNLIPESLAILKIKLALYLQTSGRIVFGTGFDLKHQKKKAIPKALQVHLSPQDRLLQHSNPASSLTGIMLLPEGPMLISSRPIVTSDIKGPIRGTVIFGRFLDAEAIARLSQISRLRLSVHGLNEPRLPADFQTARSSLSERQPLLVRPLSEQTIAGYALLKDIYGQPALLLRVDVPRETYNQGQNSLRYLMASLLLVGLVFGGLTLLLLKRLLLSQRQRQQSEARYRTLVTQASEGIFLVDIDTQQILEANAAFQKLLGYPLEAVYGLTLYEIAAERQSVDRDLPILKANDYLTGERQYRRQNGQLVDVEVNANVISYDGKDVLCVLVHDITERKQFQEQLLHNAFHDSLTGLANRALFMDRLGHVIQLAERRAWEEAPYLFSILFLDLDRFKVVNDSLGHMVGDQLLIAIAQRLRSCLRVSDTFARLGGDEFAILLEDNQSDTDVSVMVERIQQEFKRPFKLEAVPSPKESPPSPLLEIFATASIGLILKTKGYERPEELLRDADIAMYRAKARGKSRYEVFDATMHDDAVAQLQLENDLRWAIDKQEFQLYYQPIICLKTGGLSGFEALVRWQRPDKLVSPAEFIAIAEETGLIIPLGWWVLREACYQTRAWQRQFEAATALSLGGPLTISVNISSKQFSQPNFIEQIKQILQETELDARSLQLEITESTIMEADSATAMLLEMQHLGIRLAIDDFGTGYSSLSYLNRFPTDTLKIDRSFVRGMSSDPESLEIVRTVIMLARNLGMDVVAEGVETTEQLAQLKALRCDNGQGYLFSKPVPSKAATALLAERYHSVTC